jgi:hypothetical protein
MLEDKISHYSKESPKGEKGIYFIECKDYDKSIKIIQSNREKKLFKIIRNSEPDIIKILDVSINIERSELPGYKKKLMRILMMRDDEFIYDYITLDEKILEQPGSSAKAAVVSREIYDYQNLQKNAYSF